MITLIIGSPDSGKSALAESIAVEQALGRLIYLATMIAYDDVGRERIKKHRKQREGKGFITVEKPFCIAETEGLDKDCTVLLECISNLVGNEMYENGDRYKHSDNPGVTGIDEEDFGRIIVEDILSVARKTGNLIIVSNRFNESDCESCDEETQKYISCIRLVNDRLREIADTVKTV